MKFEYNFLVDKIPDANNKYVFNKYYLDYKKIKLYVCSLLCFSAKQFKLIEDVCVLHYVFDNKEKYYISANLKQNLDNNESKTEISKEIALSLLNFATKKLTKEVCNFIENNISFEFNSYLLPNNIKICNAKVKDESEYYKVLDIFKNKFSISFLDITNIEKYKDKNLCEKIN